MKNLRGLLNYLAELAIESGTFFALLFCSFSYAHFTAFCCECVPQERYFSELLFLFLGSAVFTGALAKFLVIKDLALKLRIVKKTPATAR